MSVTIFEKYGGFAYIFPIVNAFYDSILESETVSYTFDDVDMETLIEHQTLFISELMGGPSGYNEQQLIAAHKKLKITEAEWDEVIRILLETLHDFHIEKSDIDILTEKVLSKKTLIVSQPNV